MIKTIDKTHRRSSISVAEKYPDKEKPPVRFEYEYEKIIVTDKWNPYCSAIKVKNKLIITRFKMNTPYTYCPSITIILE